MNRGGESPARRRRVYGVLELGWLSVWGAIVVAVLLGIDVLGADTLECASAMLLAVAVVPRVSAWLGPRALDGSRMLLSAVSAYLTYEFSGVLIRAFRPVSYEAQMMAADQWLFGMQPSVWLQRWQSPWLTEYLQVSYVLYFPLLIGVGAVLMWRGRPREFLRYLVIINLSMLACHILYVAVPVRSPIYVAELAPFRDALVYRAPLRGVWLTEYLRESLLAATLMRFDCFPSGHTMHTLVAMLFAWRADRRVGLVATVVGGSIIFSTLYLRYHYAVDLVAGVLAAGAVVWLGTRLVEGFSQEGERAHKIRQAKRTRRAGRLGE